MRRTRSTETLVEPVKEIEHFFHERRRLRAWQQMSEVDTKPLKDYVIPKDEELHSIIVDPPIAANNFEIKPSLIGMVQQNQFFGLPTKNTNLHLSIFIDNCGTLVANGVDQNTICLRVFPFLLRD